MGKTWEDISGGMNNPVRDIEEDPDNPNVLYIATDYGVFVTLDRGKSWTQLSEKARCHHYGHGHSETGAGSGDRHLRPRFLYCGHLAPFKEFNKDTFEKDAHLFEPQRVVKWAMIERRGPSTGNSPGP